MSFEYADTRSVFNNAKKARSNIDEETKLIENRIRMIKFEEQRAQRRIQETKEKIEEVYRARQRTLDRKINENLTKDKQQKTLTEIKDSLRSYRNFHSEKMNYTQQELLNIKQNMGKRVRGWKEYIKRNIQQQIIEQKRYNRKLKDAVVLSNKQGSARAKLIKDIKEQKARFFYNKKVELENLKRNQIEEKMTQLGKEEQMLMERVSNIHEIQKQVVEDLEKVYN
jgi:hypothetical protein